MSLVPDFELGLWNAWILILPNIVLSALLTRIIVRKESGEDSSPTKREKIIFVIHHLIFLASCVYTIFLPLKLGTFWVYAGLLVYLLGVLISFWGLLNFQTTPLDKPVTNGIYRISRNPMYIGNLTINVGISMICLSWLFLLIAIIQIIIEYDLVISEEKTCLTQYGDVYREYMKKTLRWIGIPK